MILSIWTDIGNSIMEFLKDVKDFFVDNSRNPFLWVSIILLGLIIFEFTYRSLHKD